MSWDEVKANVRDGVVFIESVGCGYAGGTGSGALLSETTVLTAAHMVEGSSQIRLLVGNQTATAEILGINVYADLALLKTNTPLRGYNFPLAEDLPALGSSLSVLGFPLSEDFDAFAGSDGELQITDGTVNKLNQTRSIGSEEYSRETKNLMLTSALTNPGNSGGPVINEEGQLIGIHVAGSRYEPGINVKPQGIAVQSIRASQAVLEWTARTAELPLQECNESGDVTKLSPTILSTHDQAAGIGESFRQYAQAITAGEYDSAFTMFSKNMVKTNTKNAAEWSAGLTSSKWVDLTIEDVESSNGGGDLLQATVSFTTHQNADDGPAGLDDPTCTLWKLNYSMLWDAGQGRWLMNSQKKGDQHARDCYAAGDDDEVPDEDVG